MSHLWVHAMEPFGAVEMILNILNICLWQEAPKKFFRGLFWGTFWETYFGYIYNSDHLSVAGCLTNVLSQEADKELAVRLKAANMT